MHPRPIRIIVATLALLLVTPLDLALACNIEFRVIRAAEIARSDVRRPVERSATSKSWKMDDTWTSTWPQLNQVVSVRRVGKVHGVSFAAQRALSIDALPPGDYGWTYIDDRSPATPPCTMVGSTEWQPPHVFVKETRREVRITAAAQRTVGDPAGCELDRQPLVLPCPNLAQTVIKLDQPVGDRRLVFERF